MRINLCVAVVTVNTFIAGLLVFGLNAERRAQERQVTTNVENLAEVMDEAVTGFAGNIDQALRAICGQIEDRLRGGGRLDQAQIDALLEERVGWLDLPVTIRATDASGVVRYGAGAATGRGISYADRPYFKLHGESRDRGLVVSDPIVGRISKDWLIAFSRRFNRADGGFGGVVVAAVPVSHFATLLSRLDVGPHGIALLRDSETRLLARSPPTDHPNGQIGAKGYSTDLADIIASGVKTRTFHPMRTATGGERINTYRRLTNVPFHLVVGQAAEDYLAIWRADIVKAFILFSIFLAASVGSMWLLARQITRTETARERSRLLLLHASDGIHIVDATGIIIEASESFCRMLGYHQGDVIGMKMAGIDDGFSTAAVLERIAGGRGTETFETRHRRRNGELITVEVTCRPLSLLDQRVLFCSSRDITERKFAEDNLKRANEDLEQFAYVSSHDLQTPLRNIVSYTQLLERRYKGRLDDDADQFIGFIVDSSKRMTRLIADLLQYSRASGRTAALAAVDAGAVAAEVLKVLGRDLDEAGAEVDVGALPTVMADEAHLASLFQNLLQNGLKYRHPERKPRLALSATPLANGYWRFAVTDNGIGIEPQYFDKIFEIFQRLDPVSHPEGTGIGLTLCRRIVRRFGGSIWVDSPPGEGSTFFFTLREATARAGELRSA